MNSFFAAVIIGTASLLSPAQAISQNARWVDPFLGTEAGGNVFPGATLPFGMLKAGPDTAGATANAGWDATGPIEGFSQTHVSGTGGGAKYGNVLLQPTTGAILPGDHGSERNEERASPGLYSVKLARFGTTVQIAAARRSAIYRVTFPAGSQSNLLLDAGHCLSSYSKFHEGQELVASSVRIVSPTEITGFTSVSGGWNKQPVPYTVFFYAVTDTPAISSGTWLNGALHPGSPVQSGDNGGSTGAWLSFSARAGQVVHVKIGISFLSIDQAKANATSEIQGFDFAATKAAAEDAWNKALSPIAIEGASDDDSRQFYTALYHTMLMPSDRTGENPVFKSSEPSYDDFYAIWDTFRSSSPLLTLTAESRQSAIVKSLVDLYRHGGRIPDARTGNYNGRVQGGTDADMVLADGFLKHLPGIDWRTAYEAVLKDAEQTSPEPMKEGRSDLEEWRTLGYLSMEGTDRPASKTMEYAANDYAVALLAKGLGDEAAYRKYSQRAENWKNLWDEDAVDSGFSGFIWPRHRDGTWKANFDPLLGGTWGSDTFYEGSAWTYSTFVPQDVAGLIVKSGGKSRFVERMDAFFAVPHRYDVGNEPGFLAPYLYLWAGRPDRTQAQVRAILAKNYHSGTRGLPGNDDSGAMSSWYAFGKIGFYPNAGQDVYLIGSPAFKRVTLHLANGRDFVIETEGNGEHTPYIASATWNGKPFNSTWFTHEKLMEGGVLHLTMSSTAGKWGAESVPPSMSVPTKGTK